jgi:hypothetical protein
MNICFGCAAAIDLLTVRAMTSSLSAVPGSGNCSQLDPNCGVRSPFSVTVR